MAGFLLRTHGGAVMVYCLALALAMAAPATAGAEEPRRHGAGLTRAAAAAELGRDVPLIRMPTDVPAGDVAVEEGAAAEIHNGDGAALPQLSRPGDAAAKPGAGVLAVPPSEGPSACGAAALAVSLLACTGMALLGLVLA